MRNLSKLSLNEPLSREELRRIKGGGHRTCLVYCKNGDVEMAPGGCHTVGPSFCGGGYECSEGCN